MMKKKVLCILIISMFLIITFSSFKILGIQTKIKNNNKVKMLITKLQNHIPSDFKVEYANSICVEYEEVNDIGLDFNYMWNVTRDLANIVYNDTLWGEGDDVIRKGRYFGSVGDLWTANYTKSELVKWELEDVDKIPLQKICGKPFWFYNYTVDVIDYKLIINGENYTYSHFLPKNEMYVRPTGVRSLIPGPNCGKINYNHSFTNYKVVPKNLKKLLNYSFDYYNVTFDDITEFNLIVGNVTYIPINEPLPKDKECRIFLLEEEETVEEKLENITSNTSAVILLSNKTISHYQANTTKCNSPFIASINRDDSNITKIIELLQNGTKIIAYNFENSTSFTFSYNHDYKNWLWGEDNFFYVTPHGEYNSSYDILADNYIEIIKRNILEFFSNGPICHGIIAYDIFNDTHLMWPPLRFWKGWVNSGKWKEEWKCFLTLAPLLQMYLVNGSIGHSLENISNDSSTSISGYIEQAEKWAETYNVIGNITINHSPNDNITVISNRYDSLWGECPGDSGAGAGILLGIAKYFHDNPNIIPKCNLTFLFTTGEEFGYRGAWHYSHSHPECKYNINRWIGLDQLGFNAKNSYLNPILSDNITTGAIVEAIAEDINYVNRTRYDFLRKKGGDGLDAWAFQAREEYCDTICILKNEKPYWFGHHRSGLNYQEGDSINYQDRNDLNVTFEYAWNVIKYFCVKTDCWFENDTYLTFDSSSDKDKLKDSVKVTFSIKTCLPYDRVMVNASLTKTGTTNIVASKKINYTVTPSGIRDTIILTVPESGNPGWYSYILTLYNSTGKINEIIHIPVQSNKWNDTIPSIGLNSIIYLNPYGIKNNLIDLISIRSLINRPFTKSLS